MAAKYLLSIVGALFLVMGLMRASRLGASHPQARTWLFVGLIFGLVSAWLFLRR